MQIRYATDLSAEEYVRRQAWLDAKLDTCPLHPEGGCPLARHGTYSRKFPYGTKIARFYCSAGHMTFSLLPDCLSSRLPGTLIEVEEVLKRVENSSSQEAASQTLRSEIELPGVLRWMRRRIFLVTVSLTMLTEALPNLFGNCQSTLFSFQSALGLGCVLPELRMLASSYLDVLPPPIGFGPRPGPKKRNKNHFQHETGSDPP